MDAKPHRPLRALKVRDENLPPIGLPAKTIHQRNKSSPALSTLAQSQALKLGPKRTAFADVSNTARVLPSVKDDSIITTKPVQLGPKEIAFVNPMKSAALLRPAQRPPSVSGLRGLLNNITTTVASHGLRSNSSEDRIEPVLSQANIQKAVPKKGTVVYQELDSDENDSRIGHTGLLECQHTATGNHNYLPPLSFTSYPESPFAHSVEPLVANWPQIPSTRLRTFSQPATAKDFPLLTTKFQDEKSKTTQRGSTTESALDEDMCEPIPPVHVSRHQMETSAKTSSVDSIHPSKLSDTDVPEYWEEESCNEQYDEGYVTAKSIKSRGDYTTGATTVIMAPKLTAQAERELAAAKHIVQNSTAAGDIEEDESWDTSMVAEYGEEIFRYMRVLEEQMRPNPSYMDNQTEVQWSMRSMLMDWLVQVHYRFTLLPETLFLCVNYIDRFLSCKVVSLGKLQLVGATAIFVAAKYEEINCPSVQEIVFMVDGGYTVEEILKAERFMLSMLQFELGWPGPMSFLRRVSKADEYDLETRTLAKYFLEITIMDERFVGSIPSYTAAGAHCLARLMLQKGTWTAAHVYYSNYTYLQLRPLLAAMLSCLEDPENHHGSIFQKYSDKRFKRASHFVQEEMSQGFTLPAVRRPSAVTGDEHGEKLPTLK